MGDISIAIDILKKLQQRHNIKKSLILNIVVQKSSHVSFLGGVAAKSIEYLYEFEEIYFSMIQLISHFDVHHFGQNVASEPKQFLEVLSETLLRNEILPRLFGIKLVSIGVGDEHFESFELMVEYSLPNVLLIVFELFLKF